MRVLAACEFSGIVREAFAARGHDAWSCDLLPSEQPGQHLQCDVRHLMKPSWRWDLVIAFPPCTYLAGSGNRWYAGTHHRADALGFIRELMAWQVDRLAIENPVGAISSHIRKPDQIIHPWQFGHGETKATCLWLDGLGALLPTEIVDGRHARVWRSPDSKDRWKKRSRTLPGIAAAMAAQWDS
jgi:site-specific DNA-cytosine methylase